MATLTVRDIDDDLKTKLRIRAAENGRSMEAEVREILRVSLDTPRDTRDMATRIGELFAPFGGVELELPDRGSSDAYRIPDWTHEEILRQAAAEEADDAEEAGQG